MFQLIVEVVLAESIENNNFYIHAKKFELLGLSVSEALICFASKQAFPVFPKNIAEKNLSLYCTGLKEKKREKLPSLHSTLTLLVMLDYLTFTLKVI